MVFWEGRDRHSSSFGQRAAILGNAISAEPPGRRGFHPSHQCDPPEGEMRTRPRTVKGRGRGLERDTCRRLLPSVAGREEAVTGQSGPPCRGSSAQG